MNRRDFFRDVLSAAALAWGAPLVSRLERIEDSDTYSNVWWVAWDPGSPLAAPLKDGFKHFVCVSVDYDTKTVTYELPE